jgi:hypothetical protein
MESSVSHLKPPSSSHSGGRSLAFCKWNITKRESEKLLNVPASGLLIPFGFAQALTRRKSSPNSGVAAPSSKSTSDLNLLSRVPTTKSQSRFVSASWNLRTGTRPRISWIWPLAAMGLFFFVKALFLNVFNISTFFAFESFPTEGCNSRMMSISLSGPERPETKEP